MNRMIRLVSPTLNVEGELSPSLDEIYTRSRVTEDSAHIVHDPNDTDCPLAPFWATSLGSILLSSGELTMHVLPEGTPNPLDRAVAQQDAADTDQLQWFYLPDGQGNHVYVAAIDQQNAWRVLSQHIA